MTEDLLTCGSIPCQLERDKTQAEISLKNLQQKHDELNRK